MVSILSFDPGLTNTGWAYSEFEKDILVVKDFNIVFPNKDVDKVCMRQQVGEFGRRVVTLEILRNLIDELYIKYQPQYIVSENAFYNPRRPNAFGALLQWITCTELHLFYNYKKPLYKIPPKSVKYIASGSGESGKLSMEEAILHHKKISLPKGRTEVQEHESDAIAIGYSFMIDIYPKLLDKTYVNK